MITLITGGPCSGKTCLAIENALKQSKPVYTNIIDNTSDKSFLPKTFKVIPDSDWTLIDEPAYIIYDSCEHLDYFTAYSKLADHRLQSLLTHRHLGHDIVLIFQHEKFAHPLIRQVAEHIYMHESYYSRRSFNDL
ncbi:zonular occludens toxin domain-containing protein [Acinetobacter bereziniae]|uniref:zonular occludens toxin domain-containing protein n=1 Tax=Acinetobacter bereziniae TaxID=106648 RepID=UPI0011176D66|nr:zonular occludens toxin domain-containing protein [Acinetobacter bereziniae]TNL43664.1 hypothetical protein EYB59_21750 [Acinetobacter bereziniae]TNL54217.1 hypothetical protein EYY58_18685 [Acinetobacter bereziniae]